MASFSPSCCSAAKNKAPPLPSCRGAPDCCSAGLQTPFSQPLASQKHSELSARPSVPLLILLMQEVLFKATFAGGLRAWMALNSAGVCLLIKKKKQHHPQLCKFILVCCICSARTSFCFLCEQTTLCTIFTQLLFSLHRLCSVGDVEGTDFILWPNAGG